MDNKQKEKKSNLKKNLTSKINDINHNLNSIPKTEKSKSVKKIKFSHNRRNALFFCDEKEDEMNKDYIFKFLKKIPTSRSFKDIKKVADYLSKNYKYFSNLKKEQGISKLEHITKICRLETVNKGSTIIEFGDAGHKFYIVMEGVVEIFRPIFVEIEETPRNFLKLLKKIKDRDGDIKKYKRIRNKNLEFLINFDEPINNENKLHKDFDKMEIKRLFYNEVEEKMGEYGIDFYFGDIALINNTQRNATVRAKKDCTLLTISGHEYNKVILEFQKKQLSNDIENFIKTYSFFRHFENEQSVKLFNCFTKIELFKGDYLYKQNMDANSIYIVYSGNFVGYSFVSFPWINDYINYIDYSEINIIKFLIKNKKIKVDDLIKIIKEFQEINKTQIYKNEKNEKIFKMDKNQIKDNLYTLKKDEEKLNSPDYIFKLKLKNVNYKEILGLEEAFEFKKRFCYYRCISDKAELREVKITDLIKIIVNMSPTDLEELYNIIQERKKLLKSQIIKSIEILDKKLVLNFDLRYENLVKSNKLENEKKNSNVLLSTLKVKGYKTSIRDLLDNKLSSFPHEENPTPKIILKKINRKNKSSEELLNNFYKHKSTFNEFRFNRKKINIKLIKNNSMKNDSLIMYSQNQTPQNIKSLRSFETNYFSPKNSVKLGRNNLIPLDYKSSSSFRNINKNVKNLIPRKSIEHEKNQSMDMQINDKLSFTKNKIFPSLEKEHINKDKNNSEIKKKYNITSRNSCKNIKEFFLSKEKDYKRLFNIFNHFDKNFFLGGQFSKKFSKEYKLSYKFD